MRLEKEARDREQMVDEKRKNLELLEAVKEKRAAEVRLNKAEEKIRRLGNSSPTNEKTTPVNNSTAAHHITE